MDDGLAAATNVNSGAVLLQQLLRKTLREREREKEVRFFVSVCMVVVCLWLLLLLFLLFASLGHQVFCFFHSEMGTFYLLGRGVGEDEEERTS